MGNSTSAPAKPATADRDFDGCDFNTSGCGWVDIHND